MINIRPHTRDDVKLRVKWLNNINATLFAVDKPEDKTTLELESQWFDRYEADVNKKFFTLESDGVPIGFMGLSGINKVKGVATLFILIGEDEFRGKGFGKLALDWLINYSWHELCLYKISLEVKLANLSAIKLYKKLGFKIIAKNDTEIMMTLAR